MHNKDEAKQWRNPSIAPLTIEELASAQGVQPMQDVRSLFGTWPGEEDDAFENEIQTLWLPAGRKSK